MNTEDDLKMPMDDDSIANAPENVPDGQQESAEQREERERDERGRFAPKPDAKPDQNMRDLRLAQERDQARKDAEDARAAHQALQKRLDDMAAFAKGEDPDAATEEVDPLKPVVERLDALGKRFEDQDKATQEAETHRQVMAYADQDEAKFREKSPDFPDAVQHYIVSRLTEMQALGVTQEQAEQILAQEAQSLLYQSAQGGRSPAEAIYAMAKARGYQPGAPRQPAPVTIEQPTQQPQPSIGGRSFGNGSGPGAGGGLTAAQIAQMDEADYMAFRSTPEGKRAIQRAMGG